MSVRENIASNLLSTISAISSPITIRKATRQPFLLDELSEQQYPAVIVQTSEENRDDSELGSGAKTRHGTIDFVILGFVKGAEANIDTKRNQLITAIETSLETDITRSGNALDTEVVQVETDEGSLFPVGGIRMTIRCMYEYQAGTP
ncbi:putative mu-like protein [uncultured Mediterranean phage uvMED]|nr:putative mu-like protein [uncultured Mediterranean phage uvMED]BAR38472.1 putative mu-like protein [uncultured Mediterranean phage uvMED]|tara:strand:+ start:149 stop:589 length:441 start_codon:yes stop_codon:yes gene_type:complete